MLKHIIILCVFGITATHFAHAGGQVECPPTLQVQAMSLVDVPVGFTPVEPVGLVRLSGGNLYDGPPQQEAALKPFSQQTTKQTRSVTWKLQGEYPDGKWFSCDYAQGTLRIARRLEDASTECQMLAKPIAPAGQLSIVLLCK